MDASRRCLSSLEAWPGEVARPPLRLLEPRRRAARGATPVPAGRPAPGGWWRRLRDALLAG
jgi:hypothetical protein